MHESDKTSGQSAASAAEPKTATTRLIQLKAAVQAMGYEDQVKVLAPRPVQRAVQQKSGPADVHAAAEAGIASSSGALPYQAQIQRSFGAHDVSQVQAHTGSEASAAAGAMGAEAYASGDHVVFDGAPSLHTAAHEAAHTVQQRAGVQLSGGVGQAGDDYEKQADAVADKVVRGESAEALLGGGGAAAKSDRRHIQRKNLSQAGLDGAFKNEGQTAAVGVAFQVTKYSIEVAAKVDGGRVGALKKAAEINGNLGAAMNQASGNGTVSFTKKEAQLNKAQNDTIDPFTLSIKVPFEKDGAAQSVTVEYQHARQWSGYVISIKDSSNAAAGDVTMHTPEGGAVRDTDKYTNVHDTADGANTAGMIEAGGAEKNLDAYTKIAGEGARWVCVREHAANLQNDTFFYVIQAGDATKVWGVTFQTLWGQWADAFDKGYNIADDVVATALRDGGRLSALREGKDLANMAAKDYKVGDAV